MKQFTVITVIITLSVLVILVFLQTVPGLGSSAETKSVTADKLPIAVSRAEWRSVAPAPLYDANGTILDLHPNESGDTVSRAESRKIAPVFDATGAVVSDPSGVMWSASQP
jgi:hypothetical protein